MTTRRQRVFLGLGSNIDAARHICMGLDELDNLLGLKRVSSVYRTEAIGFDGDDFLNLVAVVETPLGPGALHRQLRDIEYRYGRPDVASKFSSRHLDIDILSIGQHAGLIDGIALPREEIFENAFVLAPFAELEPNLTLPGQTSDLATLWAQYDRDQAIGRIDLAWRGQALPWQAASVATGRSLNL